MRTEVGARPGQSTSRLPPQGPVADGTAAGVPGDGASLARLLTLAEKKSSYLISLLAESRGFEVRVQREDNLVANVP